MKVCVTGGTGFIGSPLCTALLDQGHTIRMLSRKSAIDRPGGQVFCGDLLEEDQLLGFVEGCDVLYHCAGEVKHTDLMYDLHVRGTANLLSAVSKKIKLTGTNFHWIQLSSTGAYGNPIACGHIDESFCPAPQGDYEVTKTISDELVIGFSKTESLFTYTILRPSIVVGSSMPNQSFFQLASMVQKRLFFYIGSKDALATYVHVNDVVRALMVCATDERAKGQTFILSNDCLLSEVIESMADVYDVPAPVVRLPERALRLIVRLFSSVVRLPLTNERIDQLVRRTGYSSAGIKRMMGFEFEQSIPRAMPELLSRFVKKTNSRAAANND